MFNNRALKMEIDMELNRIEHYVKNPSKDELYRLRFFIEQLYNRAKESE